MTDTEILDTVITAMRAALHDNKPSSPAKVRWWVDWIEQQRGRCRREPVQQSVGIGPVRAEKVKKIPVWFRDAYQQHLSNAVPYVPSANEVMQDLEKMREQLFPATVMQKVVSADDGTVYWFTTGQLRQAFWRCKHHNSALRNWSQNLTECEHGCEMTELRWDDFGNLREPV